MPKSWDTLKLNCGRWRRAKAEISIQMRYGVILSLVDNGQSAPIIIGSTTIMQGQVIRNGIYLNY